MEKKREKRILIVDDDSPIRTLLFTILRRRGFLVDTATNGAEAIEAFDRCVYSLVLLDLMMPRMNGWEVLQHLQERPQPTRPLVIVLTAGNEPRNLPTELVAGTIRKPFDVDLLIETVVACIAALPELTQQDSCSTPESDKSCPSADPEVLN